MDVKTFLISKMYRDFNVYVGVDMDLNKIILIGHVGKDAEIKQSKTNGRNFASFTLATSDHWKDKNTGEMKSDTQWHSIRIFNEKLVDRAIQYVKKGALLFVEGKIKYRKYNDQNGIEKTACEIELDAFNGQLIALEKPKANKTTSNNSFENIEDIPF